MSTTQSWVDRDRTKYATALLHIAKTANHVLLLDIIDAALGDRLDPTSARLIEQARSPLTRTIRMPNEPADLDAILREGGSAYRVNHAGTALEWRVDGTITEVYRQAANQKTEPGRHLNAAWRAAYGMRPDSSVAYAE